MDWGPTLTRTVDLGYEQLLLLDSRPQTRVKVIYGGVWLTEEGSPEDVFAASGDEVALHSGGVAVVEGLGYARVQVTEPPKGWQAIKGLLRAPIDVLARLVQRVRTDAGKLRSPQAAC